MNKNKKIFFILLLFVCSGFLVYAISFPLSTPLYQPIGGEVKKVFDNISQSCGAGKYIQGMTASGKLICQDLSNLTSIPLTSGSSNYTPLGMGKYTNYFSNILNNCGNGRYLRGFNADRKMICSDKNGIDTLMGTAFSDASAFSLSYPGISLGVPKYTKYLQNMVSNSCLSNQSITGFDENGIKLGCQTMIVNGVCGSSNATLTTTIPTTNLCAEGTPTAVTGSGTWVWKCNGINGGTNAICAAGEKTYYSNNVEAVSAHGGVKITYMGNHKHCVISSVYGDLEQSAWNLYGITTAQNFCIQEPLFPFTIDENGNTIPNPCKQSVSAKPGDWFIRIKDEGSSQVARASVTCTDEKPGVTGSFLLGGLCTYNGITGIFDSSGCCVVGSYGVGHSSRDIVASGNFARNCSY